MNLRKSLKQVFIFLGCVSLSISFFQLLANDNLEDPQKYQNTQDHKSDEENNLKPYPEAIKNREKNRSIIWNTSKSNDFFESHFSILLRFPIPDDFLYEEIFIDEFTPLWKDHFLNVVKNFEKFLSNYTGDFTQANILFRTWILREHGDIKGSYGIHVHLPNETWVIFDENFDQFEDEILDYYAEILRKIKYVIKGIYLDDKKDIHNIRERMWALWDESSHQGTGFESSQSDSTLIFYDRNYWNNTALWNSPQTAIKYTMACDSCKQTMHLMEKHRKAWRQYHLEFFKKNKEFIDKLEEKAGLDEERDKTTIKWTTKWKYGSADYEILVPTKVLTHMGEKFTPYYKNIQKELRDLYEKSALEMDP